MNNMKAERCHKCLHQVEDVTEENKVADLNYYCPNCDEELSEGQIITLEYISKEELALIVIDMVD